MENINVEVIKRMESFATEVLKLFPDQREKYFKKMVCDGIVTEDEAAWLEEYVCLYRLMTDGRYYKAVQRTVGEMLLTTFKGEKTNENKTVARTFRHDAKSVC